MPAIDAVAATVNTNAANLSTTITVSGGANRFLLVGFHAEATDDLATAITADSVSMTKIGSDVGAADAFLNAWQLVAPNSGTITIQATNTAGAIGMCAICFTDVDQTTPFSGPVTSTTAAASSMSDDISSAVGRLVVDLMSYGAKRTNDASPGTGQTQQWLVNSALGSGISGVEGACSTEAGGSTVTMSWSHPDAADDWAHIVISLNAPAAAGAAAKQASYRRRRAG